jgi:hypothetical protein
MVWCEQQQTRSGWRGRDGYDGEVGELWGQCVVTLQVGHTKAVMLWSARPLGGALGVARGARWLGQGAKGPVFYFSLNLRGFVSKSCAHKYSCKLLVLIRQKHINCFRLP